MSEQQNTPPRFGVCVETDDPDLLTPRMVYQVLPDENAARSGYVRVIDNEGEDYLYPERYFILVDLPPGVERAFQSALPTGAARYDEALPSTD